MYRLGSVSPLRREEIFSVDAKGGTETKAKIYQVSKRHEMTDRSALRDG